MRRLTLTLALLAAPLAGCGDKDSDDTGVSAEADADTDSDTDADSDTDTDTDPDAVSFSGTVGFSDGTDASKLVTQMCDAKACVQGVMDGTGGFTFELGPGNFAFEVIYRGNQDTYATPMVPIELVAQTDKALPETAMVYPFETFEDLAGAGEVAGDNITFLNADPAGMTPALTSPSQELYVATVEVDPASTGLPFEGIEGTVVAAWYMGNFDSHLEPAWSFVVGDSYGLAESTSLRIYTADYAAAGWHEDGTATVTNGQIVSDEGSGMAYLSHLILVAD